MSIENLKSALPAYAKDQKLNIGSLTRTTELNEEQLLSLIHISEPTRPVCSSRMPSSA